jgi:HEAT repeat protein
MSASLAASDTLVHVAWIAAQVSVAGTALLLLCVFWMHWRRTALEARRRAFIAKWRPRLAAIALDCDAAAALPLEALRPGDMELLLPEWIALHEALDTESCRGLRSLSEQLGIARVARRMLRHRRLHDRLLGAIALGHSGDPAAFAELLAEAGSSNLPLSLAAARALVSLDPARAAVELMPLLESRSDWPRARLWPLLEEIGPAALTAPLVVAIRGASPQGKARLARFLPLADEVESQALVHELLETSGDEGVLASCLGAVDSPAELPAIRRLASHDRWHIRMLAAKALGRIGEREDESLLASMLGDREWWVRYRAAQALVALPWMRRERAREMQAGLTDRFAADALEHAIAERAYR